MRMRLKTKRTAKDEPGNTRVKEVVLVTRVRAGKLCGRLEHMHMVEQQLTSSPLDGQFQQS